MRPAAGTVSPMNQSTRTCTLDPHSRELLLRIGALTTAVAPGELTLQRRRLLARQANTLLLPDGGAAAAQREDKRVELAGRTLSARLYRPQTGGPPTAASDVLLVFFHGGGWVVGDLETHDNACAFLTQRLGCTLLSVEYRKAPEHPFPAPCDDAADAYAWAAAQSGAWGCARVAIAGDSAGGHLAAYAVYANAQVATAAALLFYPVAGMDFANASYAHRGAGPGLTAGAMAWYWEQLLGHAQTSTDPRAVPVLQQWHRPPPPSVVSLAWHDPLHDEGLAYADVLRRAGADVRLQVAPDMAHGFLRYCSINTSARRHVEAAADSLLDCLARSR